MFRRHLPPRSCPLPPCACLALLTLAALAALAGCSDHPWTPENPDARAARDKLRPIPPIPDPGDTPTPHAWYFPLHESNRWVYESDDGRRVAEVRVSGTTRFDGQRIFALSNYLFPSSSDLVLFCNDISNRTVEYIDQEPVPWYPRGEFGLGTPVRVALPDGDDCIHGAVGESSGALESLTVPAGDFLQTISIEYGQRPCADAGLVREVFAVEAGLIQRTVMTADGPRTWSLTYAEVNGETFGSLPESPE